MQFIDGAMASLHASWYAMAFFTVLPMVVTVDRQLSFLYLVMYAMVGVWLVMYGLCERPKGNTMRSKFDDRTHIFREIKLRGGL